MPLLIIDRISKKRGHFGPRSDSGDGRGFDSGNEGEGVYVSSEYRGSGRKHKRGRRK